MHTNYPIPRPSNLGGAILMVGCVDKKKEVTTDISEYLIFDNITEDTVNIRSISNKDKIVWKCCNSIYR